MKIEKDHYIVQRILARKRRRVIGASRYLYLIKWKDWPTSTSTWEPVEHLGFVLGLVKRFDERCRRKEEGKRKAHGRARRRRGSQPAGSESQGAVRNLGKDSANHKLQNQQKDNQKPKQRKTGSKDQKIPRPPSLKSKTKDQTINGENKKSFFQLNKQSTTIQQIVDFPVDGEKQKKKRGRKPKNKQVGQKSQDDADLNEEDLLKKLKKLKKIKKIEKRGRGRPKGSKSRVKQGQANPEQPAVEKRSRKRIYKRRRPSTAEGQDIKKDGEAEQIVNNQGDEAQPDQNKLSRKIQKSSKRGRKRIPESERRKNISSKSRQKTRRKQLKPRLKYRSRIHSRTPKNNLKEKKQKNREKSPKPKNVQEMEQSVSGEEKQQSKGPFLITYNQEQERPYISEHADQREEGKSREEEGLIENGEMSEPPVRRSKPRKLQILPSTTFFQQRPKRIRIKRSFSQIIITDTLQNPFPFPSSTPKSNAKPPSPQPQPQLEPYTLAQQLQQYNNELDYFLDFNEQKGLSIEFKNQNAEKCVFGVQALRVHCGGWLKQFYQEFL